MKAGPELDALVCEALGIPGTTIWILTTNSGQSAYYSSEFRADCEQWLAHLREHHPDSWQAKGELMSVKRYPRVSEDISAAWQVVEKMREDGWLPSIEWDHGRWECYMGHRAFDAGYAHADTAPLAICLAALTAKGVEVPEE